MRKYLLMIIVLCFSNLKGEEGLISLQDFARDISNNRTFTFPQRRELTTPAYSIISLSLKNEPEKIKPLSEIPAYVLNNFINWTKVIIKKQYVNENIAEQTIALPNIVLFSNRTKNNKPVFSWESDILLIRNNSEIESYSWDSGSFFVFCVINKVNNLEDKTQVKEHIESLLSKYTNLPQENFSLYTFDAVMSNGIWQGNYSVNKNNYYSWKKFTEFVIGKNFSCLFFAEAKEGVPTTLRARAGDINRF